MHLIRLMSKRGRNSELTYVSKASPLERSCCTLLFLEISTVPGHQSAQRPAILSLQPPFESKHCSITCYQISPSLATAFKLPIPYLYHPISLSSPSIHSHPRPFPDKPSNTAPNLPPSPSRTLAPYHRSQSPAPPRHPDTPHSYPPPPHCCLVPTHRRC